jgi:Tol biopolymer transport system component
MVESPEIVRGRFQWESQWELRKVGLAIFMEFGHGPAQVGIVDADGSGFHVITSGPDNNAFPSFAPDGKRIVYRHYGS